MINVSAEFRETMDERTDFRCNADITLTDGTELNLSDADFLLSGNGFTDGAGARGFPLGVAIGRTCELSLLNDDGHLAAYDLFGAKIRLFLTFELSETTEKIEMGTFTVLEPETYGETVEITASDDMYKADKPYTTSLDFPCTLQTLYRDACTSCGIPFSTAAFTNDNYVVQEAPDGEYTFREIFGFIAMLAGGNARVSRLGRMEIITYDLWAEEANHTLDKWMSPPTLATDDIIITGVQTVITGTDEEGNTTETPVSAGAEGYVLELENPLFAGQEAAALELIKNIVVGATIRKFEGDYIGYPLAEFMDTVEVVDRKGHSYRSVITDVDFTFCGITTMSNSAESAVRNSSKFISPETKAIIAARKLVEREKTARETAMQHLNQILAESSGFYGTEENQPDGSTIYYLHDKPTIAESQNVMKLTSEAIGFSVDGGETYPFGFTLNGEMVMSIIQTEGLSADWITSGGLNTDRIPGLSALFETSREGVLSEVRNIEAGLQGQITAVQQSANGLRVDITEANADVNGKIADITKYVQIDTEGITIGASDSALKARVDNDKVSFLEAGAVVAYISDRQLYITDGTFLKSLSIGNFAFIPRKNGNMSLIRMG